MRGLAQEAEPNRGQRGPRAYVGAVILCVANEWRPGAVLRSKQWPGGDRVLLQVRELDVELKLPSSNRLWVKTMPHDTRRTAEPHSALDLLRRRCELHWAAAHRMGPGAHEHSVIAAELDCILEELCRR